MGDHQLYKVPYRKTLKYPFTLISKYHATFIQTNFGGGGHCCWDRFYGGNGTEPENFGALQSRDIYAWLVAHNATGTVPIGNPPAQPIAQPVIFWDGSTIRLKLNIRTEYK